MRPQMITAVFSDPASLSSFFVQYSRFHNDRHPRFLHVYVMFGSIEGSDAKEAPADNLP